MMQKCFTKSAFLGWFAAAALAAGWAAEAEAVPRLAAVEVPTAATFRENPNEYVDVKADHLAYDAARRLVLARGNVKVTRGTDWVTADEADVDTTGQIVTARGNIELHYGTMVWRGNEVTYNFKTGEGDFGEFTLESPPFVITAEDSRRVSETEVELTGVMMTTCDLDDPEYSIRASRASVTSNRVVRARNVRFHLGPVPFFWLPYLKADTRDFARFEVTPGYSSDMGGFLLAAYRQPLDETWTSTTHVDVRTRRGLALGEDLGWKDPDGTDYNGELKLYYAQDNHPWRGEKQRKEREEEIEEERYRVWLKDRHNLTDRDYVIATLNYLSDPWLLKDFFDDEYQSNVQPENRLTLTHRGDWYSAGVDLNMRLNDFFGNVNRLPEAFFDVNRIQVGNTPFYYEGENTASFLQRVYPDGSTKDDYDLFRVDTKHMLYWPTRTMGFLSVVPRGGYRGTYYSKTLKRETVTNVVAVTDAETGEVTGVTNQVETLLHDGDAVWRSLPELGVEASFKAFGELLRGATGIEEDRDLRHVFEPYVDYTWRAEPNALPEELWQFDSIDALDERNDVTVGMRNYLQTRRNEQTHNLIYLDLYAVFDLDTDEGEDTLESVNAKAELKPWSWLMWNFDGRYTTAAEEIDQFNTQVKIMATDLFTFAGEYRYRLNSREQVEGDLMILPDQRWSGRLYARVDLEEDHLDEHGYYLVHRTRCLGIGLGVRIRPDYGAKEEDDYTVWFRIWPLAFPEMMGTIGGS
jgi:LPS-assembly protein